MDSNYIRIDMNKNDDITHLEVMSDEHFGDPKQDLGLLLKRQNAILDDPNRYTAFGGDMLNNIMAKDKRWSLDASSLNSLTLEKQAWQDAHEELFKENLKLLNKGKPPKIWYGLDGNHEINDYNVDHHWMVELFEPHGIKYLGSSGFVGVEFFYKNKAIRRYKLAVAHGFGGGSSPLKSLENFMENKIADVYLMGHFHHKATDEQLVFDYDWKTKEYVERKVLLGNTGNFTNSILRGNTSWFERRNKLKPSPPGTITVSFNPYEGDFNWHG